MKPDSLTVEVRYERNERLPIALPEADARFIRTQTVLNGCTTIHPMIPPKPAVLKFTTIGGRMGLRVPSGTLFEVIGANTNASRSQIWMVRKSSCN